MSSSPSFSVTVDKRDESSLANRIAATFQKAVVFVFAVDDAGGSVIFDKRDGKELSLGLVDEGIQFGADCGWSHGFYFFGFQFFIEKKFLDCGNCDEGDADCGEGEGDVFDGDHLVWFGYG